MQYLLETANVHNVQPALLNVHLIKRAVSHIRQLDILGADFDISVRTKITIGTSLK